MTNSNPFFNKTALVILLFLFCFNVVAQVKHPIKKPVHKVDVVNPINQSISTTEPIIEKDAIEKKDNICNHTDSEFAKFPGGLAELYKIFAKRFNAPEQNVSGKVILSFIVEQDGTLSEIHCIKDIGFGTCEEAIRVLNGTPKWIPGIKNGKPARTQYIFPISISSPE
jgi:Gram-negative bacterial TonB protein C-terminal